MYIYINIYIYISYNCTQNRTRSSKSRRERLHSLSTKQPIACLDHLPPDLIDLPWPVNWHCKAIICWWCHQMSKKEIFTSFIVNYIYYMHLYTTNTICNLYIILWAFIYLTKSFHRKVWQLSTPHLSVLGLGSTGIRERGLIQGISK